MSERDDNELQERIESLTLSLKEEYKYGTKEAALIYEAELRSLTSLCRHRDENLYHELYRLTRDNYYNTRWQHKIYTSLDDMQTWETT